ncbi:RNA-binding domain-containing protein [Thermogladius sp.]|uniref:RNA-binding domain-containing protein n=1 Tax=Thermogladius sp. TaxID=2023064 RepID=UPI003D0CEB9C
MPRVTVEAEVRPTESVEKVKKAVQNFFAGDLVVLEVREGWFIVRGVSDSIESLRALRDRARAEGIEPALRSYLVKNRRGNTTSLMLHKQAAYVGRISLIDTPKESPLGPITITIEGDDLDQSIDYLTSS